MDDLFEDLENPAKESDPSAATFARDDAGEVTDRIYTRDASTEWMMGLYGRDVSEAPPEVITRPVTPSVSDSLVEPWAAEPRRDLPEGWLGPYQYRGREVVIPLVSDGFDRSDPDNLRIEARHLPRRCIKSGVETKPLVVHDDQSNPHALQQKLVYCPGGNARLRIAFYVVLLSVAKVFGVLFLSQSVSSLQTTVLLVLFPLALRRLLKAYRSRRTCVVTYGFERKPRNNRYAYLSVGFSLIAIGGLAFCVFPNNPFSREIGLIPGGIGGIINLLISFPLVTLFLGALAVWDNWYPLELVVIDEVAVRFRVRYDNRISSRPRSAVRRFFSLRVLQKPFYRNRFHRDFLARTEKMTDRHEALLVRPVPRLKEDILDRIFNFLVQRLLFAKFYFGAQTDDRVRSDSPAVLRKLLREIPTSSELRFEKESRQEEKRHKVEQTNLDRGPVRGGLLTARIALQSLQDVGSDSPDGTAALEKLRGYETIDEDAARLLGQSDARIYLGSIKRLSPAAAAELANHKGLLWLNGLTSLPVDVARALASHQGHLWLNGLTTLSVEVAEALAAHRGGIHFGGLTELDPEVAKVLATYQQRLELAGLDSLSLEVAQALSDHKYSLELNGLPNLSVAVAKALAGHVGRLDLDGLASIDSDVAQALARHEGELELDGLTDLPLAVAQALAQHHGSLTFDGVRKVNEQAAQALAGHPYQLDLGVEELAAGAAKALGEYQGHMLTLLNLSPNLSKEAAQELANYNGMLLYEPESLSEPVRQIFYDGGHF